MASRITPQIAKTLIDREALLDVITQDEAWSSWAESALRMIAP
jgi:hypothetical protein